MMMKSSIPAQQVQEIAAGNENKDNQPEKIYTKRMTDRQKKERKSAKWHKSHSLMC